MEDNNNNTNLSMITYTYVTTNLHVKSSLTYVCNELSYRLCCEAYNIHFSPPTFNENVDEENGDEVGDDDEDDNRQHRVITKNDKIMTTFIVLPLPRVEDIM